MLTHWAVTRHQPSLPIARAKAESPGCSGCSQRAVTCRGGSAAFAPPSWSRSQRALGAAAPMTACRMPTRLCGDLRRSSLAVTSPEDHPTFRPRPRELTLQQVAPHQWPRPWLRCRSLSASRCARRRFARQGREAQDAPGRVQPGVTQPAGPNPTPALPLTRTRTRTRPRTRTRTRSTCTPGWCSGLCSTRKRSTRRR